MRDIRSVKSASSANIFNVFYDENLAIYQKRFISLTHFMKGYHMSKNVKDKVLSTRITSQQNSKLSDMARELKISKSEIISYLIDNGNINSESIKKKELYPTIITYFARPFSNINQIAKKLNIAYKTSGNIDLKTILQTQEELYKIQSVLTEILSLIRSSYDS